MTEQPIETIKTRCAQCKMKCLLTVELTPNGKVEGYLCPRGLRLARELQKGRTREEILGEQSPEQSNLEVRGIRAARKKLQQKARGTEPNPTGQEKGERSSL